MGLVKAKVLRFDASAMEAKVSHYRRQ